MFQKIVVPGTRESDTALEVQTPHGYIGFDRSGQITSLGEALAIASGGRFGRNDLDSSGNVNSASHSGAMAIAHAMQVAVREKLVGRTYQMSADNYALLGARLREGQLDTGQLATAAAEVVTEVVTREGLLRRLLKHKPLGEDEVFRVEMPKQSIRGQIIATKASVEIQHQECHDAFYYPEIIPIVAKAQTNALRIKQASSSAVQELFDQVTIAGLTAEDRLLLRAIRQCAGLGTNKQRVIAGALTPRVMADTMHQIIDHPLPPGALLFAADLWTYILGESAFHSMFDAITQHELILTGQISGMFGFPIITDGFRHEELRVLEKGEMIALSSMEHLGVYADYGPFTPQHYNLNVIGQDGVGVFAQEFLGLCLPNSRAVSRTVMAQM